MAYQRTRTDGVTYLTLEGAGAEGALDEGSSARRRKKRARSDGEETCELDESAYTEEIEPPFWRAARTPSYYPWFVRSLKVPLLPIWLPRLMNFFVLFGTGLMIAVSIAIVRLEIEMNVGDIGGLAFALAYTMFAFLAGIYVQFKGTSTGVARQNFNTIQRCLRQEIKRPVDDETARVKIVRVLKHFQRMSRFDPLEDETIRAFFAEFGIKHDKERHTSEFRSGIVDATNNILAQRPLYSTACVEGLCSVLVFLIGCVFYPIAQRQSMEDSWAWLSYACFIDLILMMTFFNNIVVAVENRAYGVYPTYA